MTANTVNLISALSTFASGVSTANTTSELLNVIKAVSRAGSANLVYSYANTLPTANSTNMGMTGYVDNDGLYICDGTQWYALANTYVNTYSFQGSNYGYASGGKIPDSSNVIDKFPFASDANATDVGDLTVTRSEAAGQSSSEYGYTSGGYNLYVSPRYINPIDKFPFATDANATDVGDLTVARKFAAGQSSSDYGYTSGGDLPGSSNVIDKFPFASDANATDVGDLTVGRYGPAGQSSSDYGYTSGGGYPLKNVIDKFPFATDTNATDVGDITTLRYAIAGQSSTDYGYSSGGNPTNTVIDKFPFATDANATDVGDLSVGRFYTSGQSSTDYGYTSGGRTFPAPLYTNVIDKFSFATDGNATDVGDLTVARWVSSGQQY